MQRAISNIKCINNNIYNLIMINIIISYVLLDEHYLYVVAVEGYNVHNYCNNVLTQLF